MLKHKNRNFIFSLTIQNGHQLSYHRDIENEITSFYNNLLKKTNPNILQSIEKDNGLYYKIGHWRSKHDFDEGNYLVGG